MLLKYSHCYNEWMRSLFLFLLGALPGFAAHAARPMITDDARLTDAHACQVESWLKFNRDGTEKWALPACNPGGNLEFTLGGALGEDAGGARTTDIVLQGKTLFKPLETNGYGVGLALGNVRHPAISPRRNLIGDLYINVPTSFSWRDDARVLHLNLGVLHSRDTRSTRKTWGVGSEIQCGADNFLIAEAFGQDHGGAYYQFGWRHWLVSGRAQIDATLGNRFGTNREDRWHSIGLRLISDPLFR